MNQTYVEWYEFDVNVCMHTHDVVVSTNESEYLVELQYC